jgi:osmoprotectant transport system ATP-binding protein
MIRLEAVGKTFPGAATPAVGSLTLDVAEGEIVMLVGPSGCGKTTTLRMINRLAEPTSGRILIDGRDIAGVDPVELRRGIGYVIQRVGLFPHLSVAGNIGTVPDLLGWDEARVADRVAELADLVEIDRDMLDRYPHELSGGQRQRVGVARALAADPPVLLMDEPFGAVDPIVRGRLQEQLRSLQARLHKTIVFVTHDIDEAILLGDRVAVLDVGGVLAQYDPPEALLRDPANQFVADFLGAERGLKRLALRTVADLELDAPSTVAIGSPIVEARAVAERLGTDWVTVVDGDRLVGWVEVDAVTGDRVSVADARRFAASCDLSTTLRQALDLILGSRTRVAVVTDTEGRLVGMVDVERLAGQLTR